MWYSKFRNFCENFILANTVRRHICDFKIALGHDLPISVKDRSSNFVRIFFHGTSHINFAYAKFHENKTLTKIYKFNVTHHPN